MSEKPSRLRDARRYLLGLRPRMLAALLLTSAVTLAVAALLLFSPLEQRLRADGESAVLSSIATTKPEFQEIKLDPATGKPDASELAATARTLRRRSGGQVTILDKHLATAYTAVRFDQDVPDFYTEARRALTTHRPVKTLLGDQLIVAQRTAVGPHRERYVIVVMRRLAYVSSAVKVVQNAFTVAAAAGLAIALVLSFWLTRTLLRRLERLHDATHELVRTGLEAPLPVDERPDEIGDLTRAFAGMQGRLRHQEAARRAFVSTASHELRTPLASLDGTLELLADDLDPDHLDLDDARERTRRAREQSRRLSNLASDLLDLSRLDAEVTLRAEPVELGELCRAVAAEFERRAADGKVRVEMRRAADLCWAQGDPGALARIVRILLDNALRVAPKGSSVHVHTSAEDGRAQVLVSDSGPGVPTDERERIFERFQRGSTTGGASGFGLGLAIGRELAERMGGTLDLADQGRDGGGASFAVRLPRAHVEDEQ
ncbi:MAG: sensor histidine kinase [Solirubrobacteraceae bacterium]